MKFYNGKSIYTADDEEPKCERCENICEPIDYCVERCGPEHGWNLYSREVIEEECE